MKYDFVKFLITEESNPLTLADKLNKKAANYGKNGNLETEAMLKTIVRQAGKDSFAIGDGKYIQEIKKK